MSNEIADKLRHRLINLFDTSGLIRTAPTREETESADLIIRVIKSRWSNPGYIVVNTEK